MEQNNFKKKYKKIWKYEKHIVYLYQIIEIAIGHRNQGNTFHVKPTRINSNLKQTNMITQHQIDKTIEHISEIIEIIIHEMSKIQPDHNKIQQHKKDIIETINILISNL